MARFSYTVDTQPMADEMESVSRHVNVTTGAVVAMQAAVIAAEARASDHVCSNVNRGFYSLIRSQISQKLAKLQSEVDSLTMQLIQQKNALLNIRNRMQRDYNMISARYVKLFNGLNTNLKNRVFELDKPTISFANKEIDKISNRTKHLAATMPITQSESISVSQRIIASNVKRRGLNVINSMQLFIREMNVQKVLTDQILINNIDISKVGMTYIPICIMEYNTDRADHKNIDIVISKAGFNNIATSAIKNKAHNEIPLLNWGAASNSAQDIFPEFNKLLMASSKDSRIKDITLKLYGSNKYLTI